MAATADVIVEADPIWQQLLVSFAGTAGALLVAGLVYRWTRRDEAVRLAAEMSNARQMAFEQSKEVQQAEARAIEREDRVRRTAGLHELLSELAAFAIEGFSMAFKGFDTNTLNAQRVKDTCTKLDSYGARLFMTKGHLHEAPALGGIGTAVYQGAVLLSQTARVSERINQMPKDVRESLQAVSLGMYLGALELMNDITAWQMSGEVVDRKYWPEGEHRERLARFDAEYVNQYWDLVGKPRPDRGQESQVAPERPEDAP